jgi:dTDP-4-amino-4,6-dideoxygalactose transaminase
MIPYTHHHVHADDVAAVREALQSDWIAGNGPYTERLEAALCDVARCKYAVVVNSGTAALHLAYLACGVGPGTTVLTSPVSFVATANAALMCGAEVGFWDLDVKRMFLGETVVPVTLGGNPVYPSTLKPYNVVVDACHGPYSIPKGAQAACISLHAAKHVAAGEGGAILTNDIDIEFKCRSLRDHGRIVVSDKPTWDDACNGHEPRSWMECAALGYNYRMPDVNAALALSQLARYEWNVLRGQEIAARYDEAFAGKVETVPHSAESARHLYQILHDDRNSLRKQLLKRGVGTQVHYEPIIPLQKYYRERFGYKTGMWPNAERYAARTLSIPMFPTLTDAEIDHVVKSIQEVV